jgi:hypothetical protein
VSVPVMKSVRFILPPSKRKRPDCAMKTGATFQVADED